MKEIMAIIRINMINQTKRAISEEGIVSLHARECLGRGKGLVDFLVLKDSEQQYEEAMSKLGNTQRLIPKRMLTLVVPDSQVGKVVNTIIKVNRTGKSGDGKIFVMPVNDSIRVRTGETGNDTLDE
jgi:nitrogen regulatory protein PII 2